MRRSSHRNGGGRFKIETRVVAAVTAVNGPLADLTILHLLQSSMPALLLARAFRAQTCIVWSGMLLGYLLAPQLLRWLSASAMVAVLGAITAAAGLAGFALVSSRRSSQSHAGA